MGRGKRVSTSACKRVEQITISIALAQQWRAVGAARGLCTDAEVAAFLLRHYRKTNSGIIVEGNCCVSCNKQLPLYLCAQCDVLQQTGPPVESTSPVISTTGQPTHSAQSAQPAQPTSTEGHKANLPMLGTQRSGKDVVKTEPEEFPVKVKVELNDGVCEKNGGGDDRGGDHGGDPDNGRTGVSGVSPAANVVHDSDDDSFQSPSEEDKSDISDFVPEEEPHSSDFVLSDPAPSRASSQKKKKLVKHKEEKINKLKNHKEEKVKKLKNDKEEKVKKLKNHKEEKIKNLKNHKEEKVKKLKKQKEEKVKKMKKEKKPRECPDCGKVFPFPCMLKRHAAVHSRKGGRSDKPSDDHGDGSVENPSGDDSGDKLDGDPGDKSSGDPGEDGSGADPANGVDNGDDDSYHSPSEEDKSDVSDYIPEEEPHSSESESDAAASKANDQKKEVPKGKEGKHECPICGEMFPQSYRMKRHMKVHDPGHGKGWAYSCKPCRLTFRFKGSLETHMRKHNGQQPFACNLCTASFMRAKHIRKHMASQHGEADEDQPRFRCDYCKATFVPYKKFIKHVWKHSLERKFQCPHCPKAFFDKCALRTHMLIHNNEKPFTCPECGASFKQMGTLKGHMRVHTGERPYVCKLCQATHTTHNQLKHHMWRHRGERPYLCQLCGVSYSHKKSLDVHIETHNGEKPHKCEQCDRAFSRRQYLLVHMRRHSGYQPYVCSACGKTFFDSSNHRRHFRLMHTGTPKRRGRKPKNRDASSLPQANKNSYIKTELQETPNGESGVEQADLCQAVSEAVEGIESGSRHVPVVTASVATSDLTQLVSVVTVVPSAVPTSEL